MVSKDRLLWMIDRLQHALGWQVEIERKAWDQREYTVNLSFNLQFSGKAWHDVLRSADYRDVVFEMVRLKLEQLWEKELSGNGNGKPQNKGNGTREVPPDFRTLFEQSEQS